MANIRLSTTTLEGKNRMEVKLKFKIFGVELSSATNRSVINTGSCFQSFCHAGVYYGIM